MLTKEIFLGMRWVVSMLEMNGQSRFLVITDEQHQSPNLKQSINQFARN